MILIAVLLIISFFEVFPQETNENSLIEKFLLEKGKEEIILLFQPMLNYLPNKDCCCNYR